MDNWGQLERRAEAGILPGKLVPAVTGLQEVPARLQPLLRSRAGRLVLVHAAAGYGKTTALAATREPDAVWYNLDRSDSSPLTLAARLCAVLGLEPVAPDVPSLGEVVALDLAHRLQGRSLAITLDRFEQLGPAPEIGRLLSELVVMLPGLALRVATRVRPALPLERLRLSGHLVDVGPAELRLHRREIVHVLRAAWGRSPRPAEIEFADTVVAGWPAPLQLWQAGVRCQGDLAAPLQPGQPLHDYLHEEFVRTLDPTQMKAFGTDLGWLAGPGPLVSRATNPSRRAVADRIVRDRIAVVPGPAGWELHPLAGAFVEMHVARPRTSGAGARTGAGAERPVPRAGHAGPSVAIRTLGGLQVMVGGFSIERAALPTSVRRLLELLLCLPGYQATAHQAARLLWPHHLERSALNSFNVALHGLRRLLEPELTARSQSRYVLRHGRTYRLCLERIAADVEEFCQLVRLGQSSRAVPASEQLEAAVELYRGDFLASSSEDYARQRRVQLRRVALDVLDRLGAWHSAGGDGARALRIYERLLELEPHREDVWGRVLELHVAAGDEHQALAALQRCEQTLGEAGIEPSALLKELHRRIREERPRSGRRPLTA